MDSYSYPLLKDALSSFGSIEDGVVSGKKCKTTVHWDDPVAFAQHPFKRRFDTSLACLLSVAFSSLAVVYLMLRCLDLLRERYRMTPLVRLLSTGGGKPCRGVEGDEGDGQGEEVGKGEGFGVGNLGGPGEFQVQEGHLGHWKWQMEENQRWPSAPATTVPGGIGGIHGLASGRGHATTAALEEEYVEMLRQTNYLSVRRGGVHDLQSRGAPQFGPGRRGRKNHSSEPVEIEAWLLEGETLEMWEDRKLPSYAEVQVVSVFRRMMEAASACRSLLGVLTQSQRLQLSCEMMKLLGLELGAISLVREHLEPLRSDLGDAVVQLGLGALKHTAAVAELESYRESVRELIVLVLELKQPRPPTEENFALRYRTKMVSILRTASTVVGYCLGVPEGLLKYKDGESSSLLSCVVEQQIGVLKALYDAHSSQIAMDSSLRYFILTCQKRIGAYPILGDYHKQISANNMPPLMEMVDKIHEAVRNSGGLLQAPAAPYTTQYISQPQTPRHIHSPNEALSEPAQQFTPAPQLYLAPPGVTAFQSVQLAATSTHLSHPRFPPPHVRYYASQLHQAQPPPSPYSRRHFGSSVSRSHHQQQAVPSIPSQATTRTTVLEQHQHVMPTHGSGRGDVSATVLPYSAVGQEAGPLPQPYSQQPRPILVGPYAHAGAPRYPSQSAYSISDHGDRPPLLQPATRRTVGMSSWGYRTLEGDSPQQEEEEEVEEVEGLLGELIKGGLNPQDIFPWRKHTDA